MNGKTPWVITSALFSVVMALSMFMASAIFGQLGELRREVRDLDSRFAKVETKIDVVANRLAAVEGALFQRGGGRAP